LGRGERGKGELDGTRGERARRRREGKGRTSSAGEGASFVGVDGCSFIHARGERDGCMLLEMQAVLLPTLWYLEGFVEMRRRSDLGLPRLLPPFLPFLCPHLAAILERLSSSSPLRALRTPRADLSALFLSLSLRMYIETHTHLSHLASSLLPLPPTSQSYLLSLYSLTLERDALLSQISFHHEYRLDSSRKLFELERAKLEDDYRKAREGVKQMLLDKVEERRKRLREEKDGGDILGEFIVLLVPVFGRRMGEEGRRERVQPFFGQRREPAR